MTESRLIPRRSLQEIAEALDQRSIFIGGPVKDFERVGRLQCSLMIREGLYPWLKVVDIGCGALRGGYWLIHFLNPDCYYGIEPNVDMLQAGLNEIVESEVIREKRPTFDHNAAFDTSVFNTKFDAFLCRSVWTHTSKAQIETMLDNFLRDTTPDAFFLTSYLPAFWPWDDYRGRTFQGRSHVSNVTALVRHRRSWIRGACQKRGLLVSELPDGIANNQRWLKIFRLGYSHTQPLRKKASESSLSSEAA